MALTSRSFLFITMIWYGSLLVEEARAGPMPNAEPVDDYLNNAKLLNPKNEFVFKRLLDEHNIILPILNAAFNDTFREIRTVRQNTIHSDYATSHTVTFNIYCKTQDGRSVIVEMQLGSSNCFVSRSLYYVTRTYGSQLDGMDLQGFTNNYDALKPVYFLAFVNFDIFPEHDQFTSTHVLKEQHTNKTYIKDLKFTFVNLSRLKKKQPTTVEQLRTDLEKFAYFLLHDMENTVYVQTLSKLMEDNDMIKTAVQASNKLCWKKEDIDNFEQHEEDRSKFYSMIESAKERGVQKCQRKIVIKGNNQKLSIDVIAKLSKLSEAEVKKIIKEENDRLSSNKNM